MSASIEEEYAKRLNKLAKMPLGNNEIGDLVQALQTVQMETAAQASYHLQMSSEIHSAVEQPTAEFANRLANLKKGQQASIEKSWRNKGLHEAHVAKVGLGPTPRGANAHTPGTRPVREGLPQDQLVHGQHAARAGPRA